jgi:hypothetical protein
MYLTRSREDTIMLFQIVYIYNHYTVEFLDDKLFTFMFSPQQDLNTSLVLCSTYSLSIMTKQQVP